LRRSCDGYGKASSSDQPDHSSPPLFAVFLSFKRKGQSINNSSQV
jgi:hypothetical protein